MKRKERFLYQRLRREHYCNLSKLPELLQGMKDMQPVVIKQKVPAENIYSPNTTWEIDEAGQLSGIKKTLIFLGSTYIVNPED